MTQNVISTYGDMWLMKAALEKAGKPIALRRAAVRTMDGGPSKHYPRRQLKSTKRAPRWRRGGDRANGNPARPLPYFARSRLAAPFWPKKSDLARLANFREKLSEQDHAAHRCLRRIDRIDSSRCGRKRPPK